MKGFLTPHPTQEQIIVKTILALFAAKRNLHFNVCSSFPPFPPSLPYSSPPPPPACCEGCGGETPDTPSNTTTPSSPPPAAAPFSPPFSPSSPFSPSAPFSPGEFEGELTTAPVQGILYGKTVSITGFGLFIWIYFETTKCKN